MVLTSGSLEPPVNNACLLGTSARLTALALICAGADCSFKMYLKCCLGSTRRYHCFFALSFIVLCIFSFIVLVAVSFTVLFAVSFIVLFAVSFISLFAVSLIVLYHVQPQKYTSLCPRALVRNLIIEEALVWRT